MFPFIIATFGLLIILLVYFRLAVRFNIVDEPNWRSSHKQPTIIGGGILFPAAAWFWFFLYGLQAPLIMLAILLLAVVSFLDDTRNLSPGIRVLTHFVAVTILFWQLDVLTLPWIGVFAAYLFTIGWLNAFNFMDGINGISAGYVLVSLGTFAWLNQKLEFVSQQLLLFLILSVLIFSFFNMRKRAVAFAGDVGSIPLAFLLAWFMIALMMKTNQLQYILFFALYGIDTVSTIVYRLWHRENIFKAHRSHLYQLMSNELGWSHLQVAAIYASLQAFINIIAVVFIPNGKMPFSFLFAVLFLLSVVYIFVRKFLLKEIKRKATISL